MFSTSCSITHYDVKTGMNQGKAERDFYMK